MEATAFGDKASEELEGHCGRVESGGALELPVPCLAHHDHDELDAPLVSGVVQRVIGTLCGVLASALRTSDVVASFSMLSLYNFFLVGKTNL